MLFKTRFKAAIRDGSVTSTFRAWTSARVVVGNSYRLGPDDVIVVKAVDKVMVGAITAAAARSAGFADTVDLVRTLERSSKTKMTARSKVFHIKFRHEKAPDPRASRRQDTSAEALDEIALRLRNMDGRSRRGPWTRQALQLIADYPRIPASQLAPRMQRETRAFKADVRKLKELGLTVSHEAGYSLSPRGRAVLRRSPRRRDET